MLVFSGRFLEIVENAGETTVILRYRIAIPCGNNGKITYFFAICDPNPVVFRLPLIPNFLYT